MKTNKVKQIIIILFINYNSVNVITNLQKIITFGYKWQSDMNQLAKYIIAIAVALVIGFIAWFFSDIVIYIIISAVLSLMGKPIMEWLNRLHIKKFHLPKWLTAAIALFTLFGVFASLFFMIAPLLGTVFMNISNIDIVAIQHKISEPLANFNTQIINTFPTIGSDFKIESIVFEEVKNMFTTSSITSFFASVTSLLMNTLLGVLIVLFITFFFIKEENMFDNMVLALFPDKYEANVRRALSSIYAMLVRYFFGLSIQILGITTLNTLGLTFVAGLDFSFAIVLAFLTGVLNIIPYIGPWIGAIFATLIAISTNTPDSAEIGTMVISMGSVFLFTQLVDNFVFQPVIFSNSAKAHPLEIFIVLLIAASIAGVLGMLVAIPSYTIIRVFAREFFSNFKLVKKLTDQI